MIIVIVVIVFMMMIVGGGAAAYFLTKDDSDDSSKKSGGGDKGTSRPGDSKSTVKGLDDKDTSPTPQVNSSSGGMSAADVAKMSGNPSAPDAPGGYKPIGDKPLCSASLCTGTKTLKSKTKKGTTAKECCRDKACSIDWNPDNGGDENLCKAEGKVFNEDADDYGKTNDECCKFDTTSYARWCVQDKAYKADGSTVKTNSPMPLGGVVEFGVGNHPNNKKAYLKKFIKKVQNSGSSKAALLSTCKRECDKISDCSAFYLRSNTECNLFRPANASDLKYGIEKSNINVTDTNLADMAHEFYYKSTYLPENMRKMTIDGKVKVAGVDEDFCPFNYTSFYGWGSWDNNKHSAMHPRAKYGGDVKCYGPGGTHHGVKLMNNNNTVVPMISSCATLCDKVGKCGGFWVYGLSEAHRWDPVTKSAAGKCCLKYDLDPADKEQMSFTRPQSNGGKTPGGYFIKVKNGVMGPRPWRKSYLKAV